jgi:glycosyltransferase involved in cell wall biosynthesis
MSDDLDICAMIQHPDTPGDQWRIVRPFARLRQAGIDARWVPYGADPSGDPASTVLLVRLMTGSDTATIDRWLGDMRRRFRAVVYECDDLLWSDAMVDHLEAADFTRGRTREAMLAEGELTRYFISQCDGVIVSCDALAELLRPHTSQPVVVVPNAIDARWFRAQLAHRAPWADQLTIGWAGGRRPEADVAPMAKAWGRLARRYPHVRFVLASPLIPDVFYRELPDLDRVTTLGWREWDEYPPLYQVDIGCCSVAPSPFSLAKTPIKAWEYALAGAAVVASPALYGDCVAAGRGFIAQTADEWADRLELLIGNADFRQRSAARLAEHVEQSHALDVCAHRWTDAIGEIVAATARREAAA